MTKDKKVISTWNIKNYKMKKHTSLSLLILFAVFLQSSVYKHTEYLIFAGTEKVSIKDIVNSMQNQDLLFFGEEHNDSIGHIVEFELLKKMHSVYGAQTVLSLEMFDRDIQSIMDEYLAGLITEKYFNKDSRQWVNYQDYKPLVEYCKENKIPVICANAPFRYVNLVSNKGYDALQGLSPTSKTTMAPLPYQVASVQYRTKLEDLLGEHAKNEKTGYDLIRGQSLWDATMAYSIVEFKKIHPQAKILHLNGKLHTEERLGIIEQLKNYDPNIKSLVITSVTQVEDFKNISVASNQHLADYVLYTSKQD
jgi:uncharacterized iron-regulated protein